MMQSEQLKELEKLAASDSPCPKDLEPPETMLFYMLSGLYAQYHSKRISKEEAQKRKSYAMIMYKRYQDDYKQFCDICKRYQELIKEGYSHDNLNNNNVSLQGMH